MLNKSWIEILMEPSNKNILIEEKTEDLNNLFQILEKIRKLNVSFDELKINFYELDLLPLQDALFNNDYKSLYTLKEKIKENLYKYIDYEDANDLIFEYKSLLKELDSYMISDLYKIKKDVENMNEENFDYIFTKKNILEGLDKIIEEIEKEDIIEKDIGNDPKTIADFKKLYDTYSFEITKAKNIIYFLSLIIN